MHLEPIWVWAVSEKQTCVSFNGILDFTLYHITNHTEEQKVLESERETKLFQATILLASLLGLIFHFSKTALGHYR